MIKKEILIKTIEDFDEKIKALEVAIDCGDAPQWNALEWYKMSKAWRKFQDAIEMHLLPFVNKKDD